jgi:hypothetical protein
VPIESGLVLQAYLTHVIAEANIDYKRGTSTKEELDQLFK